MTSALDDNRLRERLEAVVMDHPWLEPVLRWLEAHGPPGAALGAGCVVGPVWNRLTGRPALHGLKDVDVVWFDPADDEAAEAVLAERLRRAFPEVPVPFDAKNQARVHRWYAERFGYSIAPYRGLGDAVTTWPTTANALAVAWRRGRLEVIAPFGLADLFALELRANPVQITRDIFEAKAARWSRTWPELRIHPWPSCRGAGR